MSISTSVKNILDVYSKRGKLLDYLSTTTVCNAKGRQLKGPDYTFQLFVKNIFVI
jgi:hypothetical protein